MTTPVPSEPQDRHRACWYSRRLPELPEELGFHSIADGFVLYCAHPMMFPVVGYEFDVRNCAACEAFKPARSTHHDS
jgi:hypothetical protein